MAKSMSMRGKSLALPRILSEIAANGPLTFARFMDVALYDPLVGYYASAGAEIGKRGDFFTNVSVGPIFGKILARQFREMWLRLGRPCRFSLVEQGANDGQLALDILSTLDKQILTGAEYWIVEPLANLRRKQAGTLRVFKTIVHWVEMRLSRSSRGSLSTPILPGHAEAQVRERHGAAMQPGVPNLAYLARRVRGTLRGEFPTAARDRS